MPKQIGWSNESNLLYTISSQISRLAGIIATSGGGGGGTITGGGAAGQVTFWDAATNITGSNNLFWDAANSRLGIGTNAPQATFSVKTSSSTTKYIEFSQAGGINYIESLDRVSGNAPLVLYAGQGTAYIGFVAGSSAAEAMRLTANRNLLLQNGGTFLDSGERLQVTGTSKFVGNMALTLNQNATTSLTISNTTSGASSTTRINFTSNVGGASIIKNSTATSVFKIFNPSDFALYNDTGGDIAILNDFATGTIKFATGGVSTAQMTLFSTGNFALGSTTDDNTNRLQVSGSTLLNGATLIKGAGSTSGTNALVIQNSSATQLLAINDAGTAFFTGGVRTNGVTANSGSSLSFEPGSSASQIILKTFGNAASNVNINNGSPFVVTLGAITTLLLNQGFAPTSGNATFSLQTISPTINQVGATGITRGLYINPTLTPAAVADWRSIQWDNNTGWGLYGAGTAPNYLGGDLTVVGVLRETVTTNRQTVSYTLVLTDRGKLVETNVGAANTITVPPNSSITFPIGTKIDIAQYGAGQTTIVPGIGVTVRSAGGALKLSAQYSGATIVKIGTDEWYLFGDITV